MAFDVLDEHEQGELVQKWLRENALSIATGIVLGLVLLFGWQQWKAHRARHAGEAATQYQALVDAIDAKHTDDAHTIADALRKDYADSAYAVFAAMRSAEMSSSSGDLKAAADDLAWAQDHAGTPALKSLAAIDLARVRLASGDADAALKIVDALPKDSYAAIAGELRGDILAKLGRTDDARKAYQDALSHLDAQAPNRSFVQMKLDDLGALPAASAAPSTPAETSGS
ncbi:MAG TPA: tetratricopeptide repeat protein [Rhodanobacteraceae bacterium]|jgi:predicted negative regulator of RcsB-dependent stress response|nr:tetratricopeptide repeat protein [Rhodanobacteraceae bacterium]